MDKNKKKYKKKDLVYRDKDQSYWASIKRPRDAGLE